MSTTKIKHVDNSREYVCKVPAKTYRMALMTIPDHCEKSDEFSPILLSDHCCHASMTVAMGTKGRSDELSPILFSDHCCHASITFAMGTKGRGLVGSACTMRGAGTKRPAFELSFVRDVVCSQLSATGSETSLVSGIGRAASLSRNSGTKLGELALSWDTSPM